MVAAPPRPQLVVRKPPLWRRRWVRAVAAALVVGGLVVAALVALRARSVHRLQQRERAAITSFLAQLKRKFPPGADTESIPPDAYAIFPTLTTDLTKLTAGQLGAKAALAEGKRVQSEAQASSTAMGRFNVNKLFPPEFTVTGQQASDAAAGAYTKVHGGTQSVVLEAQFDLTQAFNLWAQAGSLMQVAANTPQRDRKAVTDQATTLTNRAGTLFDHALQKLLGIKAALGIASPNTPTAPLPTAPVVPSPPPSPSPAASASASGSP